MGDAASAAGTAAPLAAPYGAPLVLQGNFARRVRKPGAQTNIVALPY